MKIYLVGGAVRDKLLQLPVKERDWVVVGGTSAAMIKLGYRSVGKDFPVFLEPKTHEEYALARKERKVGRGYTGFDFDTSMEVSLEDDLIRRDLTVNAMAEDADGQLIDPYGGQKDLKQRILRHVSPAFTEDPVRILRVARFAARYAQYGFTVAPETIALMKSMVTSGEVDALVPERVWKELERALGEKNPEQFFQILLECEALAKLFPALMISKKEDAALSDHFVGERLLVRAAQSALDKQIRFAAFLSRLSEDSIKQLCEQYRIPNEYRELALLVGTYSSHCDDLMDISLSKDDLAKKLFNFLVKIDAFRREERFTKFLTTCKIISDSTLIALLEKSYQAAKLVTAEEFVKQGIAGKEIGEYINKKRCEVIAELLSDH